MEYNLWNGNSDDVVHRLMNGLCELAIIMEPHNAEGVNALPVYKEPWIAMIPQGHPLAALPGDTIDVQELADYDLLIPSRGSRLEEISNWFEDKTKVLKIRCHLAHMVTAYELASQGIGIALYPASAQISEDSSVCIKRLVNPSVTASYVLIWCKNRTLSHVAEEFLTFVQEQFSSTNIF